MHSTERRSVEQTESKKIISVMICTRNRGETALMAVRTVLANTHPDFECVVIDQSTDTITRDALLPYCQDPRFRYVHSDTKGLGKSHNIGMHHTRGDIVAITDDDCEVPSDWLEKIENAFESDARIGMLFCTVSLAEHDRSKGFIPGYSIDTDRVTMMAGGAIIKNTWCGIGAGMAVRRACIEAIGGFDDHLGPGALFPSADETDIVVRALIKGYSVLSTNRTHVLHYGFRTWEEGKVLTVRDGEGSGAAHSKHFRSGVRGTRQMVFKLILKNIFSIFRDLIKAKRLTGAKRVTSYLNGFRQGMRIPIDRETLRFLISTDTPS